MRMHSALTNQNSDRQNTPWSTYTCKGAGLYEWQVGPLKVWLQRSKLEWRVAHEILEDEDSDVHHWKSLGKEPKSASWQRWAFSTPYEKIVFTPFMPDRPLVVKTHIPTHIPAGMEAVFYVNIPLCARIAAKRDSATTELVSISSVTLSDTWFGTNFGGDLCYALKTQAVRTVDETKPQPHRALCPISIANKANEALPLQKICIRAKCLNIYASDNRFWTNKISVNFLGKGMSSRVYYNDTPPAELNEPVLIHKASDRYEGGFFKTLGQSFIDLF